MRCKVARSRHTVHYQSMSAVTFFSFLLTTRPMQLLSAGVIKQLEEQSPDRTPVNPRVTAVI